MHRNPDLLGIYVHFPYCIHKCRYCDFFSVGMDTLGWGKEPQENDLAAYCEGVLGEFAARTSHDGAFARFSEVNTVYFGGGTASLLPPAMLARLLETFRDRFVFTDDCEVTLEGNPENFTAAYLGELALIGVTRVNSGVQTFQPKHLERVGRYYDAEKYASIMEVLSESAIQSVGVDLMYGFPGQRPEEFRADLSRVLEHRIDHLSIYSLTAEPGTAFASDIELGRETAPDEDLQELLFGELPPYLETQGFAQYEVSNYARAGRECRHNLRYWLYEPYLGLGPGAHGFTGQARYANARHVGRWQEAPAAASHEGHRLASDLPLSILRIALPFDLELPDRILQEAEAPPPALVRPFLEDLVRSGAGRLVEARLLAGPCAVAAHSGVGRLARENQTPQAPIPGFQWTMDGLLHLDAHVLALAELLATSPEPKRSSGSASGPGSFQKAK